MGAESRNDLIGIDQETKDLFDDISVYRCL